MQWLTPLTALYAAAVSLPLLLLLYFLKLKRIEQPVSSTLLWKRAVQDLQVNAPFQRLRRNILLLLQLVAILAVLAALAGPIISMMGISGRRFVLIIDRSASMNALDAEPSRLEEAKKQAKDFVESISGKAFISFKDKAEQVMVIAVDDKAKVMCNFTSDKRQLFNAIDGISPGDGTSSLWQAITVSRAFAQSPGEDTNNRSSETPAKLILFSDGRISDADNIAVAEDELIFNSIGVSKKNIALIAMQAKRAYENPSEINVFATVANYDLKAAVCDVQLSIDGDIHAVKKINLPPSSDRMPNGSAEPGKVAISFTLEHEGPGILELRQMIEDDLPADDAAWTVLAPPQKLVVMLVTENNVVLETVLKSCPIARVDTVTPIEFAAIDQTARDLADEYDIIVLDNNTPEKLPGCNYITFGKIPGGIDIQVSGIIKNQYIVDWRSRHAIMKYVNLTNIFAAEANGIIVPRDADVLAELNETPAITLLRRNGSTFLVTSFDILQSNWPFEPGFVLFCYNATSFLAARSRNNQTGGLKIGDPIIIEGMLPSEIAVVKGPGFESREIKANSAGILRIAEAERAGLYSIETPAMQSRYFAANLLDSKESNIEPLAEIVLSGSVIQSQEKKASPAGVPVWPFLAGIALLLVLIEWFVYNSKIRL